MFNTHVRRGASRFLLFIRYTVSAMRETWKLWLTTLLLTATFLHHFPKESWFCEGRLCGVLACCCDQPDPKKTDENCQRPEIPSRETTLCAAGCGCTPVFTASSEHPTSLIPGPAPSALPVFVLVEAPATPAPMPYASTVRALLPDYRGPPTTLPALPSSGLRAPPAS